MSGFLLFHYYTIDEWWTQLKARTSRMRKSQHKTHTPAHTCTHLTGNPV